MEDWKQRSKALLDQIYAVDPYYVSSNEYRFIGQASYADIAAGRTSPSSRNCSPYRQQRDVTPSTTVTQVLRPILIRVQKSTVECLPLNEAQVSKTQIQEIDLDKSKMQPQQSKMPTQCVQTVDDHVIIGVEENQQDIPEVVAKSPVTRRGRSPTRKINPSNARDPKAMRIQEEEVDHRFNVTPRQEARMKSTKNILALHEEQKGRSPSPMWVPGSASYADILRGCMQTAQVNIASTEPFKQEMIPLSGETLCGRTQSPRTEQVTASFIANVDESQQITEASQVATQETQVENVQIAEAYCQPSEIKVDEQSYAESEPSDWAEKDLEHMLQHVKPYENVPRQPVTETVQSTEIYDYMVPEPMPKLIGFIESQLRTYPVSSYVYASSGHQQVQQLDTANLNPYNNSSLNYPPEHYVVQTAYLSASDIYQETPMHQPCPVNDARHEIPMLEEKAIEVPVTRQEALKDAIITESIDTSNQEELVNASETPMTTKTEEEDTLPLNETEAKTQIFSYAQILSQGLSPRVSSTYINKLPTADQQNKEQSSLSFRELSPLQDSKCEQDSHSIPKSKQLKQSKKNDWDTIKKREIKKKQLNDKTEQTDEKKSRKIIDKPMEKQKKESLNPSTQSEARDELNVINDNSDKKKREDKPDKQINQEKQIIDSKDMNLQEKKRKQKKKKVDKSVGDEIDKALKEIEDMDKQKIKSHREKLKEQIEEQNKSQNSANETSKKSKEDADRKQRKLGETSIKSGKTKEITKMKENVLLEQATLQNQNIAMEQSISKDNAENKDDMKMKILNSNDKEKIQKDISNEILKNQSQIDNNIHVNSDKPNIKAKHKNKMDKNTKDKEQGKKSSENKVQKQSDVLSDKKNDKINIVEESSTAEIVELSVASKIELENEKSDAVKTEHIKKQKDASKKKSKTKSKKSELNADSNNKDGEKRENDIKEIDDKHLKSIELIIDNEIENSKLKKFDTAEIVNKVNSNAKDKTNPKKKDKVKNKIKSEVVIDRTPLVISTSKVSNETKMDLNDTENESRNQGIDIPKTEQIIKAEISKTVETIASSKIQSKEIVLPSNTIPETQNIIQTDITYKDDKICYDIDKAEEYTGNQKLEHYQANAKLGTENIFKESLEAIDTTEEKKAINSQMIEKIEKREVEKRQIKTGKQKKSQKAKLNAQDKNKISKDTNIKTLQLVESENKSIEDKNESKLLDASANENFVQDQSVEKINLTEHVLISDNNCLIQSKTHTENNFNLKIDEKENATLGQVNQHTPSCSKSKKKNKTKGKTVIQSIASTSDIKSTEKSNLTDMDQTSVTSIVQPVTSIKEEVHNKTMEFIKDTDKPESFKEIIVFKDNLLKEKEISEPVIYLKQEELDKNSSLPEKIDDVETVCEKTQELLENIEAELDSTVSSDLVSEAKISEQHEENIHDNNLESEQLPSTGKALIIEKTVITVTTTSTSVPGSIQVKPADVKSVKSVEILENIPLPKIVGSKVTELITLRPETVEASLITTYARVPNDFPVSSCPAKSDQAIDSQTIGLISASSTENIMTSDESTSFDSTQHERNISPGISEQFHDTSTLVELEDNRGELDTHSDDNMERQERSMLLNEFTIKQDLYQSDKKEEECETDNTRKEETLPSDIISENDNIIKSQDINNSIEIDNTALIKKISQDVLCISNMKKGELEENKGSEIIIQNDQEKTIDEQTEIQTQKCENNITISEIKSESTSENVKTEKKIIPDYLLDIIKPYAIDRHAYNHAESNFYRHFKIVKIVKKEIQPLATMIPTKSGSIERIVQESVMKPKSMNREMSEINCRRHAIIIETPKYPISSFYEIESQWIKDKFEKSISISTNDSDLSSVAEKIEPTIEKKITIDAVSADEIRQENKTVNTTFNTISFTDITEDSNNISTDSTSQAINKITKLNASIASPVENINDNQLINAETITETNVEETVTKDNIKIEQELLEIKTTPIAITSINLKSDDDWINLLDEEIILDDDFDAPEIQTVTNVTLDDQIEKKEKKIEKKESIIEKREEKIDKSEVEVEKTEVIIEKQEEKIEKKESIIEKREEKIDKSEAEVEKTEVIIEKQEEKIEKRETITNEEQEEKIENEKANKTLDNTTLMEIAVKDEYHTDIKDAQNDILCTDSKKQNDKTKNQAKKKKESKQKDVKAKDNNAKIKAGSKKQNNIEIKTDSSESDLLSTQSNLEKHKTLKKITEPEMEKSAEKQESELSKDNAKLKILNEPILEQKAKDTINEAYEKPLPKFKEYKSKSSKKSKKQIGKSAIILKEKSVTSKQNNTKEDLNSVTTEIESKISGALSIVQKQQESTENNASKCDRSLDSNDKSWSTIETPPKQDMHFSSLENQSRKNLNEELKTTTTDEIVKPPVDKSVKSKKQLKESNKSYAQIAASSRRTSPQTSQKEICVIHTIEPTLLKPDDIVNNTKISTSDELHENLNIEKLLEQDKPVDEIIMHQSADQKTDITKSISQNESVPWIEEMEEETSFSSTCNSKDDETCTKVGTNTWAAIVGKKSIESPEVNNVSSLEQNLCKLEQTVKQRPLAQVQIYVEETIEQEPIENLIQVDEQGFMEFVNRKELRSRRSRSRSRSARRNEKLLNENKIQNAESKTIQEIKPEQDGDKMSRLEKNKSNKDQIQDTQINNQKELTSIENPKEEQKFVHDMETCNKFQLKNIEIESQKIKNLEDQSMKEMQLIKDRNAQENGCTNVKALPIKEQSNATKSKKKLKNKKAKIIPEQQNEDACVSDISKKVIITGDLEEKKRELLAEPKLDDEIKIKLEEVSTIDIICNKSTNLDNEKIPVEEANKQENIEQQAIICDKTTEQKSVEQNIIIDEPKITKMYEKSCKKIAEENITEQKEISKLTRTEKRRQKKKAKTLLQNKSNEKKEFDMEEDVVQNKSIDSFTNANIKDIEVEKSVEIIEEFAPLKDKIDVASINKNDESITEIQTAQIEPIEKSLEKSEPVIENKTLFSQVNLSKDKEKPKNVAKAKKEKRLNKAKSQDFIKTADSKETETLFRTESTGIINISKDVIFDITQPMEDVKNKKLDNESTKSLQFSKDTTDKVDASVISEADISENIKKSELLAFSIEKEISEIKDLLLKSEKGGEYERRSPEKHDAKIEDKEEQKGTQESQEQKDLSKYPEENITNIIEENVSATREMIDGTRKEREQKTESSFDYSREEKKDVSIDAKLEESFETSNKETKEKITSKQETNEKQFERLEKDNTAKKLDSKSDDTLELNDTTMVNNEIAKVESVPDNIEINKSDETGIDRSSEMNDIHTPIEFTSDIINVAMKHSLPLGELSVAQQSFEAEDKLKRVASIEQENFDVSIEPMKSKVQFYIADEILVLNPDRRKSISSVSFLHEQPTSELRNSRYLSIDHGFWLDKRPYHEAERDHFENLAFRMKKRLTRSNKRDSDDRDRPRDRDDDRDGNNSGGRSRDTWGDSRFLFGSPQTERMIADLPGGICSWRDYSTYLSNESERTADHSSSLDVTNNQPIDSDLSLDYSLPDDVRLSSLDHLLTSPTPYDPRTESRTKSLVNISDVNPKEYLDASSSNNFQCSDYPSTCIQSSTLVHLRPRSKLHLGKETRRGSVQRCGSDEEMAKETTEDESEKRIRRIQETVEEDLVSLQIKFSTFEETVNHLPMDSIESILSSLMNMLTELRTYDEEVEQLQRRLHEIPADIESQRLLAVLTEFHPRITSLFDQAEQGRKTLEQAREGREKRGQEIRTYKLFLEETNTWLKNLLSKIDEQHSFNTNKTLQEELRNRAHRVSELESLPEVNELAIELKKALMNALNQLSQKQQEICDEQAQADDESTEKDNGTLDEAPSINSSLEGPPSLADVSLQTGQSLLIDDVVEKKAQFTKQTSTTQIPSSTTCHSLMTQTSQDLIPSESAQTQETIKILKTTKGDHDVIEIATKYLPPNSSQELVHQEQSSALPSEDIVVNMKYQDAKESDSATSELNIVHVAPQSFETVLNEPDDITTEVVVDADGTKRIIVRKLRRTTTVNKQTTQQHMSTLSTALGDTPLMMQAFSEAAMRDQQVTVTKTRPDGTIETITKQIYGGKVTTGAGEGINVEEYESEPRYTRIVTQGQIGDISGQPVEEEILMEGGEYQTRTSSVHAVVQQVTKRVIKKTRKIIRKVTIIDGKETTTEEVIEEPEEIEIKEQDIPYISINVVKNEDEKIIVPAEEAIKIQRQETMRSKIPIEHTTDSLIQGPFFGPFAKDIMGERQGETKENISEKPIMIAEKNDDIAETDTLNIVDESTSLKEPSTTDSKLKLRDSEQTTMPEILSSLEEHVSQLENVINVPDNGSVSILQSDENIVPKEIEVQTVKHFPTEVNGISTLVIDNQALIDAERSAVLQTPVEDVYVTQAIQPESLKSPLEPTDDESVVTKTTCKSDDAPIKIETLNIELENGTVDVELHHDVSSTVEADSNVDISNVVLLEEEDEKEGISKKDVSFESSKNKEEDTTLTSFQQSESQNKSIILPCELDIVEFNAEKTVTKLKDVEAPLKEQEITEIFTEEQDDNLRDEALKPEYKPVFHKVEIALSVSKEDEETEPFVSVKTQAERSEIVPYSIVKEDVDISLPTDKNTKGIIRDKIVQTAAFLTAEKGTETLQLTANKEVEVHIESSEQSKSDTTSYKSRKKKRHKDKTESPEKSVEAESSTSIATSIAESMEINILSSDSSKHDSEQPQPDVAEIIKSSIDSSLSLDDGFAVEENGYQPDDNDILSIAPDDENGTKRKRKKKKKQKIRLIQDEDLTQMPKTSSDDGTFTDEIFVEIPKLKEVKDDINESDAIKENNEAIEKDNVIDIMEQEDEAKKIDAETTLQKETIIEYKVVLDDANTQTTLETCDVSTSFTPKIGEESSSTFMQTSPEPLPLTLEEESQTDKTEEINIETQTVLEPSLDFIPQNVVEEVPEVENLGTQTMTPEATPMEEFAIQTSPIEDVPVIETEMEDSQAQTTEIDVLSTEMQTSPIEVVSMITNETQTTINTAMEVEQQTTPPPVTEEIILHESGIQTLSPEIPESLEKDVQTSVSDSPEPNVLHTDTQTITIPEAFTETIETQTTPEESPRKIEVQEAEVQIEEIKSITETTMQTSPTIVSPEPIQVHEESIQTSIEETKQTIEEESQTSSPERIQTFDSSMQIETEDLIPQIEKSVQNIPDVCEISAQTSLEKENQPAEMTSISQQTTLISTHTVETSTDDSKIDVIEKEDLHKTPILETDILKETPKEEEKIFTEIIEVPAASDVQVRKEEEIKEMEVVSDEPMSEISRTTAPENIEQRKASIEEEIHPQFSEIPIVKDELKSLDSSVKTEESTKPSSILENYTTPDTSFEIHVHASIELSASDTLDISTISDSKETPDSSQDTTLTEELNNDVAENNSKPIKRQRRKRKHKTMEISLPNKDKSEFESVFGEPIKSQDTILKLSYCDVAKKNVSRRTSLVENNDALDDVSHEHSSEMIPQIESDQMKSENIPSKTIEDSTSRHEEDLQNIPDISTSEQLMIDSNRQIPETTAVSEAVAVQMLDRPITESLLMSSDQEKSTAIISTQSTPEPMDTTEELLSPIEIEQSEPFQADIPTAILESHKKLAPSLPSTEICERKEINLWQESVAESFNTLSPASLLEKSLEYDIKSQYQGLPQAIQAAKIITDRVKNLQNTNELSYLGNILHIAHLEEVTTDKLGEERSSDVRKELAHLRNAIQEDDMVIVEEAFVTVVETISTWLETIEYRIFLNRECPTGPSHEDAKTFIELKDEINHIKENVCELDNIWKRLEPSYPEQERERLQNCMNAVEYQMKIIEHITIDEEEHASKQLARWDEFLNGVNNVYRLIDEQHKQLDHIIESEHSTHWKLQELNKLDNTNRCHMWKTSKLLDITSGLLRDYPGKIIPDETYTAHEMTKIIGHNVYVERERLLQLLVLAEEYEQTLQEFAQITEIAENLLDSPISVMSLEYLQEEMQKHRKFFVNLNHCRAILESLEGNLDPETRAKHSDLHKELHDKATALLDQAASRAQQMALAASRWMLLEQSVKEERGWLQVAHQRVPDLQTVTSNDYDQYISLYQSLSADVATHRARLIQLFDVACSLRDLINIEDPEDHYGEILDVIVKLQDNIESSLRRLLAFRESWNNQETLMTCVEQWMTMAEKELAILRDPSGSSMRQFWELKAQYEVHNNMRNEADNCFEQALQIIPLSDEILQRQFHYELQDRWNDISNKINEIQVDATRSISSEKISSNEKLKLFEKELNELRMTINSFYGVLKTKEELDLYIERLTVLFDRISLIQDEIGRLGLLPAAESEKVGFLLSSARCIEGQISEELDSAQLLREKIQLLQRGLSRFRKAYKRLSATLDQCEGSEKQESDLVAAAVNQCQSVADELIILWQDLMALRQMLHSLPTGMRVTVSPVGIERDLSSIQDVHTELESRCTRLLSLLTNRLGLWRRFEKQLEIVQQSVQEADYMMELLTVQGSVDYERLLKATERLEGLNGDLGAREVLISELRAAAEPLRESCAVDVREKVDAIVNEAVQAWEDTRAELSALCTRYQHACKLWQQYRDSSAAVKTWMDTQMNSVVNLPPEETAKQVKICEETLAEHKERLAELRVLVAQIASDVGLNADGPLHCDVETLGQRLEDVQETLSTFTDTVDSRVLSQELACDDLYQTKNFLDYIQRNLMTVSQDESNEQLTVLRNHLLALTRTEPQLQFIKDRALDMSVQEPSVLEVIRLWQSVIRETFKQYHRLLTRLIRSQDVIAALKLWEEYLTHVQEFLSTVVPSDYNGLSEHRNICEIHEKLLPEQQNLISTIYQQKDDTSVIALTCLHNETLARVLERHKAVCDRLSAWDKYRLDQSKLLTWFKEVEKERQDMHLQFIHLGQLDKILQRIQVLLDKIPTGESHIESLEKQHEYLLTNCEEAVAVSIRMKHAANAQRIANLRAGLETWRDFVRRVQKLHEDHIKQSSVITTTFQEISQALSVAFHAKPMSLFKTKTQLDSLKILKSRLTNAQHNLETLSIITEQLKERLSPSDMKTLNQHETLLTQQYGDLEYQLVLLGCRLEERCNIHVWWEKRLIKLLSWITDTTLRIHDHNLMALNEPEEALKRFANELQAEMSLKQRELEWLQNTGQELIDIAEETEKENLQRFLTELNEKWNHLMVDGKARASKLLDLIQTMSSLLKKINDLRTWLTDIEGQLSEDLIIEKPTQENIDKKLEDHECLKATIEAESGNISQVLNLCEILLNDCNKWKSSLNTEAIRNGMKYLEKRWKIVCIKSTDRKKGIMMIWKLLQELDKTKQEYEPWLSKTEKSLSELEKNLTEISKEETENLIEKAKSVARDIEAHQKALKILEQIFGRLAKSGLDSDNFRSLTSETRKIIDRWLAIGMKINAIIPCLQQEQKTYREFLVTHGAAVVGLTQVDIRLTQMQHLATPEQKSSLRRRRQQLREIEEELETQNVTLQKADELALRVMQDSNSDDVATIQELVDEYQRLWQNIKERVTALKTDLETREKSEVDEAVQVETLKFEQDTAVQVDTLPRLMTMTSCDAYLIEFETSMNECNNALNSLEAMVTPKPVSGLRLNATAKTIAKLIGSCQSSLELVHHFHILLMEDGKLSTGVTKSAEVTALKARYDTLIALARTREQQIKELRSPISDAYIFLCDHDNDRLICPLCSHRNWTQLDNDFWRLDKWLEYAEGTQSEQCTPPSDMEQLEDVIQDHREFLLDFDSHKSILTSLNIIGAHLVDHTEDIERAKELRDRLSIANKRWENIRSTATQWQKQLQHALVTNHQFYRIVEELIAWLERTEDNIRASEPIDLTESINIIEVKYNKFRELRNDLERCEPRVISLQEATNHLLDEQTETRIRLQELRLRLQSLRRLTGIYTLKLGAALGLDLRDVGLAATSTSLASLSHDLLDEAATGTDQPHTTSTNGDENNRTILARGYRFLGRVLRVSLPIQALMLLLLGIATLVPSVEEDYSCMLSNNLARSFTPIALYPNGPPPV